MITDPDEALDLVNELLPVYTQPVTKSIMNIQTG
jgi:ferric-dicitrate binding protein FerR (iron transport regulator)